MDIEADHRRHLCLSCSQTLMEYHADASPNDTGNPDILLLRSRIRTFSACAACVFQ